MSAGGDFELRIVEIDSFYFHGIFLQVQETQMPLDSDSRLRFDRLAAVRADTPPRRAS